MDNKNYINFITFARGENQLRSLEYMTEATKNQIEVCKKHNFPSTVLLMYDALIEPAFSEYIKNEINNGTSECGLWFEIPVQLCMDAGIEWRGREGYTWDWHNDVGFLMGYTPEERIILIDTAMDKYREIFGTFPEVIGCWHMDAFSLNYINEKYNIKGACMCRDQWGTDGYTLWGGYEPIYYPCKNNMFCPANSQKNQIDIPMLRMLGADPLYQFDIPYMRDKWKYRSDDNIIGQITLEPTRLTDEKIHHYSGMNREWCDWFFKTMENSLCLPFSYAQTAQENDFGWDRISDGFQMQCDLIEEHQAKGLLKVELMSKTCERFKSEYKTTPCTTVMVDKDWMSKNRNAFWYYSPFYRSSVIFDDNCAWIRELRLFNNDYKEPYLATACRSASMTYDNLPIVDGTLWSVNKYKQDSEEVMLEQRGIKFAESDSRAGLYPVIKENNVWRKSRTDGIKVSRSDDMAFVKWNLEEKGEITVEYSKSQLSIFLPENAALQLIHNNVGDIIAVKENEISYLHNGFSYSVTLNGAELSACEDGTILIIPKSSCIYIQFNE